jgi:hypothetical protein
MLRNAVDNINSAGTADLSLHGGRSVAVLIGFIDKNILGFPAFYLKHGDSKTENRISDLLVEYLTCCLDSEGNGFIPYRFVKNPTQAHSTKESDIGVRVRTNAHPLTTIAEFEAKRLSGSSTNTEYVYGERGGIERFKRGHHASHLSLCGMFGYVQSKTIDEWTGKINGWIQRLADADADSTIDWKPKPEKLVQLSEEKGINKWRSTNDRKGNAPIQLYHYFINLC